MFALALLLVAAFWELYKVIGPQDGGTIFGWTILPRANAVHVPRRDLHTGTVPQVANNELGTTGDGL